MFAILILTAVELLTLSALSLATHENAIADAQIRTAQAQRLATAAIYRLRASWPTLQLDTLRVGRSASITSESNVAVQVTRISGGLYHATATSRIGHSIGRSEAILRTLDSTRALHELNEAVASAGPLSIRGATASIDLTQACDAEPPADRPATIITIAARRFIIGMFEARIDSAHAVLPPGYALAGVRWEELPHLADVSVHAALTLPLQDSTMPAFPVIYARGDLVLDGAGQGILLVGGNFTMNEGTQFDGIIVVRGSATIHDGARVTGALRMQGSGLSVIGAATLTYSRCTCGRALAETPARRRLIAGSRFYIPAF